MAESRVTRGSGLLENLLARKRAAMADRLIRPELRSGRLLDVGCGSFPHFLSGIAFEEKFGIDKIVPCDTNIETVDPNGVRLGHFDVDAQDRLPFDDAFFDVVTMLAVFEHIVVDRLVLLIDEIHRVLKPSGLVVITTPAGWTGPVLSLLKILRLVSKEEIDEHQDSYSRKKIRAVVEKTDFADASARFGSFELFMNNWVTLEKSQPE